MSALFDFVRVFPEGARRSKIMETVLHFCAEIEKAQDEDNLNLNLCGREVFMSAIVEGLQEMRRNLPIDGEVPIEARLGQFRNVPGMVEAAARCHVGKNV